MFSRFRLFIPILAGANLRDRMIACFGALIGICLTGFITAAILGKSIALPIIVAPIGASAVLLFAVPASPLAQPWSIIGGNVISALVGITVVQFVDNHVLAIGLGVGLAIAAMSFGRCLHPPGGAAALTAIIGGPTVTDLGYQFALIPVGLNSAMLVILGIAFHKLTRRKYPHVPAAAPVNTHKTSDLPASLRVGFNSDDVSKALASIDETFDIDPSDLDRLLRQVELQALVRTQGKSRAKDIMSRDVISITESDTPEKARALLLDHNIRTLPVIDEAGKLKGTVGLRELQNTASDARSIMVEALTASPDDQVVGLVPQLTDGRAHAIIVTDRDNVVQGLISQTDLLSALARSLRFQEPDQPKKRKSPLHLLRGAGI
ncbi:CBS domain-containing membrane protein [Brucella pseudogrignonensis]|uniref:CBS domain-containing membrane protein n=2 Tax=Brucella pseudogrignonensis TaxID=419475 RepID=A0ABU1MBF2_9HYPH|nr:CBS domain-containing membrane protein [Brucella pseudogrignonensis]